MDVSSLSPEYASAIALTAKNGYIVPNLSSDNFEAYKGLDSSILVNPMSFTVDEREAFKELCKTCPKMYIGDDLGISVSSATEYLNG